MRKPVFAGVFPLCFADMESYDTWVELAKTSYAVAGPCTDCTPEYQQEMIKQKRCENPDIRFKIVDGEYQGTFRGNYEQ
jgi:hypothetical protein